MWVQGSGCVTEELELLSAGLLRRSYVLVLYEFVSPLYQALQVRLVIYRWKRLPNDFFKVSVRAPGLHGSKLRIAQA